MTQTTVWATGRHPFQPTPEMIQRHNEWLDEYVAVLGATGEQAEHIRRDMSVESRPNWMNPMDAMALVVTLPEDVEITDPDRRLEAQDAMRTLSGLSKSERLRLVADAMGITVASARQYDLANPVKRNTGLSGRTALYRHYDHAGTLLYIGIAKDPDVRFALHRSTSRWHAYSVKMDVEWHDTRPDALRAERIAIASERPVFNQSGSLADPDAGEEYLLASELDRIAEMLT